MITKVLQCLTVVAAIALFVALLTPDIYVSGLSVRFYTVMAVSLLGVQLCVVWFFLSSLRNYQPRLRFAYRVLSAGVLLLGIAQLQLPIIVWLKMLDSWWISSGLVLLPFGLSVVAMYVSAYIFARTVGVRSWVTRPYIIVAGVAAACALSGALPHIRITGTPDAELQFDVFVGLTVWTMLFNAAASVVYRRVSHTIGSLYAPPMRWLAGATGVGIAASLSELLYSLLTPTSLTWYTRYGLNLLPVVAAGVVLLVAGVRFKEVSNRRLSATAGPIDVVVYMAQLASEPQAIDGTLDLVRDITARMSDSEHTQLSSEDEEVITHVYADIENYLVHNEPVRKFSQEELRSLLPDSFGALLTRYIK